MGRCGCSLVLVVVGVACDPCEDDRLATVGVEVSTVDAAGNPVAVDAVTYRLDGGDPVEAQCRDIVDGECTVFVAGGTFDVGTYEITASVCGSDVTETVEVQEGHCGHTEMARLEIVVDAAGCN